MKLARKLAMALILVVCAVVVVSAFVRSRVVLALFDEALDREHRVVGRAVASAVGALWSLHRVDRAREVVRSAGDREAGVDVHWVAPRGGLDVDRALAPADVVDDAAARAQPWPCRDEAGNELIVSYVAVPTDTGVSTFIELVVSASPRERYLRTSLLFTAITALFVVVGGGAMAALIGVWLVGRPVDRLVAQARRVGAGDLTARLDVRANDELGILGVEMNEMADALHRARADVTRETAARLAANEQLRQADRLRIVGGLASGVAHELGTPLTVVAGRAEQIAMGETSPEETVEYAQIIMHEADRMTTIIRQLLDFARRWEPIKAEQDLRPIVEQTRSLLAAVASKRGVALEVVATDAEVKALFDAGQMQQVFTNVVVNAIHAMPKGGTVRMRLGEREINPPTELASMERRFVYVEVEDEGVGISEENKGKIFEPFFTTKDVGEGTGLGLSVSWGIVHEHGGFIDVESEVGKGSQFTIYLPALRSDRASDRRS